MSTPFEWRSNGETAGPEALPEFDTAEGCLFACSAQETMNPTLSLVGPAPPQEDIPRLGGFGGPSPSPGDDLSPPNAVDATKMNGIAVPVSASAGWSQSPPKTEGVYPSCVAYDVRLKTDNSSSGRDSLEVAVSLEYTNPRWEDQESMVVKVAVAKTLVNAELGTELDLVASQFQEFVPDKNSWVDITADVDYTQTANAVVDAVMKDPNSGQTAGKATVTAKKVEMTLGPFSCKARLNLIFQADRLYTYQAMSIREDAADIGAARLLPLYVSLPFAPVSHEAGLSNLAVRLQAPPGTSVLPLTEFGQAYHHLKQQELLASSTILAVSDLSPQPQQRTVGYQFQWESLPPRSTGVVAWLALPNNTSDKMDSFDFVQLGQSLASTMNEDSSMNNNNEDVPLRNKEQAQATIQVPATDDVANLQVPLPGHGPMGNLYRIKVKMPEAKQRQQPTFILNLTLSDRSGSTSMRAQRGGNSTETMRQRFNELAEVRFLKRLESIPALVQAGVLHMDDVWMDAFLAFDSAAPASQIRRVVIRIRNVHDHIVEVVQAIRSNNFEVANARLPMIFRHVQALRGIQPGGTTDFSVGPKTLVHTYAQWKKEAQSLMPAGTAAANVSPCTFVEFDTDGGHNGASGYLEAIRNFCKVYDVRDGVVTGFGSWLNQDCASKVANVLGSVPALLSLQVPQSGSEGMDKVFRAGFSAWIGALRRPPKMTLKLSAGCVSFPSGASTRNANAVEVLAVKRIGERRERLGKFGPPDVSDETFTKAVITDVPAGDELLLYVVSRLGNADELAGGLEVLTSAEGAPACKGQVWSDEETKSGNFLGYDWLKTLTNQPGRGALQLAPLMSTSLASRLEDEVSFRFNIASPSGKTSFLGRCKTVANRAPIDAAHQPGPPPTPLEIEAPKPPQTNQSPFDTFRGGYRGGARGFLGRGGGGGRRGGPPPQAQWFGGPHTTRSSMRCAGFGGGPAAGAAGFGGAAPTFRAARADGFHSSPSNVPLQQSGHAAAPPPPPPATQRHSIAGHGISFAMDDEVEETTRRVGVSPSYAPSNIPFDPPPMMAPPPIASAFGAAAPVVASPMASAYMAAPAQPKMAAAQVARSAAEKRRASGRGRGCGRFSPSASSPAAKPTQPEKPKEPSWMDALCVPVGSSKPLAKQDYEALFQAMNEVVYARQRVENDPRVLFVCDVCSLQFVPGQPRYHCFDCQDFDACANCRGRHKLPFHRVALVNPGAAACVPATNFGGAAEDPLVGGLLGTTPATATAVLDQQPPKVDQTVEWCKLRIARFLLAVLHWWPVFRATCVFRDQLPADLADEMGQKIADSFNSEDIQGQTGTLTVIVDTLVREDQNMKK